MHVSDYAQVTEYQISLQLCDYLSKSALDTLKKVVVMSPITFRLQMEHFFFQKSESVTTRVSGLWYSGFHLQLEETQTISLAYHYAFC